MITYSLDGSELCVALFVRTLACHHYHDVDSDISIFHILFSLIPFPTFNFFSCLTPLGFYLALEGAENPFSVARYKASAVLLCAVKSRFTTQGPLVYSEWNPTQLTQPQNPGEQEPVH